MKYSILSLVFLFAISSTSFGQVSKIIGKWRSIDDVDGTAKSVVNIYQDSNAKYYGKIEKLFKEPDKLCTECKNEDRNKPIVGMVIISDMVEKNGSLTGGTILDPNNGKVYRCNISYDAKNNNLKVRGSLDSKGLLGRSQIWIKE